MPVQRRRGGVVTNAGRYVRNVYRGVTNRVTRPQINKPLTPRAQQPKGFLEKVCADFNNAFITAVSEPAFIVLVAMVAALIYSHAGDIDKGPLAPLFPKDSTNAFVKWVRANVGKFLGGLAFIPPTLLAPAKYRVALGLASAIIVFLVPPLSEAQYGLIAVLYYLYFHVRNKHSKIALVAIAALLWFSGFLAPVPPPPATDPRRAETILGRNGPPLTGN